MSSNATDPAKQQSTASDVAKNASPANKGKAKAQATDEVMEEEEEEEEEEEDDDEEMEEEEEDSEEETFEEIDPSVILPTGRRTRGVRVDYTSKEALARAGLTGNEKDEDEDEEMRD